MQNIKVGDVILANFPYEDISGRYKLRPAVVMKLFPNRLSVVALKVTTTPPRDRYDFELINWALAGLNRVSTVRTTKRAEIPTAAIVRVLGSLSQDDYNAVCDLYNSLPPR